MESEKPRGIRIPAARAMTADAFLNTPTLSAGSVPIRAPLTIDDDSDSGSASSYSRGTDVGFESVSDDETELEDVLMGGIRVHSLLGEELIGETGDGSVIYRSFEGDIEEETCSSLEEESEVEEVSVKAKVVIPKAILSLDDDEILHSDDEDIQLQFRTLHYGDVDEPESSDSSADTLSNGLISLDEQRLGVPRRGSNYFKVEENEESMGLGTSSKQLIEKEVVRKPIFEEDDGCSTHEFNALMKPSHVEGEEDMVQVKLSEENSLSVAPRDCNEFIVEGERNAVEADNEFDETFSQCVDQGEGHECISKERVNTIDDDSSCEADGLILTGEGSIGLGSKESGDEDTGEAGGHCKNDCTAISDSYKQPETGMSWENLELTSTLEYVTTRKLEVAGGIDVISGCGSSEEEAENVGKQEVEEDIDRQLSLLDEDDRASILTSSNESVENGEQVSEQISKQAKILFDSEPNQISVGIEETSFLSVKSVERIMPENSSAIDYDLTGEPREKYTEELSSDHSLQLISEKVKKRVEKTEFLKAKLQRIIRRIDLCSENSSEEYQTSSLGSDRRKINKEFPDDVDLSINILVIGKTGVGKSATVNSIFGEVKSPVGAFGVTTKSANYITGNVGGILVRILDTPGLLSSATEERFNQEVLMSIKKSMTTFPVDVILYIDRLDENPDIHLLRIITNSLGSSIWQNTIMVLTHSASLTSKDFVAQRSSYMHQSISQVDWSKMPGIVMAENNNTSESDWRLNLLILCCSVKIQSQDCAALQKYNKLQSLTLLCSLWTGVNSHDHSNGDFKESLEPVKKEEEKLSGVVDRVRTRKGRLGFQATKRFGVYVYTADLHTGFSIGYRKDEEGQRRMLVRMRGSMSVLGLVPMLISLFTCVYGRKNI